MNPEEHRPPDPAGAELPGAERRAPDALAAPSACRPGKYASRLIREEHRRKESNISEKECSVANGLETPETLRLYSVGAILFSLCAPPAADGCVARGWASHLWGSPQCTRV